MKRWIRSLLEYFFIVTLGLILCEVLLHFYNPLPTRVRGNKIILKANFHKNIELSPPIAGLDTIIHYSTNSLGFRGAEPPEDLAQHFSIYTMGGSTTECSLLSDEKTWSALLAKRLKDRFPHIWLNNAGIDGCSTYGHRILLDDYLLQLKPSMVIFLMGINDRGRANFNHEDGFLINRKESWWRKLIKKSELLLLVQNLYQRNRTEKLGIGIQAKSIALSNEGDEKKELARHQENQLSYRTRVLELVNQCLKNGTIPLLVTQSLDAEKTSHAWKVMDMYNRTTIEVAKATHSHFFDLGNALEPNSDYYYDGMHYTNKGAAAVADLIYEDLASYLLAENILKKEH